MITIYASPKSSSVRYFWCLEKVEETYNASSINLKGKHPELFERMNKMEINSDSKFFNVPLQHFNEIQSLDDFSCDSGHCMV